LYGIIILNILSLLSLIFFVQNEHKKRANEKEREEMIKTT